MVYREGGHVTGATAAAQQHNTLLSEVCCGGNMRLQSKGSLHMADNPKAQKQDAGLMFQHTKHAPLFLCHPRRYRRYYTGCGVTKQGSLT